MNCLDSGVCIQRFAAWCCVVLFSIATVSKAPALQAVGAEDRKDPTLSVTRDDRALGVIRDAFAALSASPATKLDGITIKGVDDEGTPYRWNRVGKETSLEIGAGATKQVIEPSRTSGPSQSFTSRESGELQFLPMLAFESLGDAISNTEIALQSLPDVQVGSTSQKKIRICKGKDLSLHNPSCQIWYFDSMSKLPIAVKYRTQSHEFHSGGVEIEAQLSSIQRGDVLPFPAIVELRIGEQKIRRLSISAITVDSAATQGLGVQK
ncbi:hypothetical protein [Terriglobus albidus]|uniref:hypothetical protein n=1 Tax=Terriglobus albidus TaxID=1592106 RepID=UPI0021DF485A|nr:hypothetical protein [Terriglobus albidus]